MSRTYKKRGHVQFQIRKSFLIRVATDEHPVVLEIFEPKITICLKSCYREKKADGHLGLVARCGFFS